MFPATDFAVARCAAASQNWTVVFVRHRFRAVYEYSRSYHANPAKRSMSGRTEDLTADVVVTAWKKCLARLRGLSGTEHDGPKVVCIGGAAGGGRGGKQAPQLARDIWKMELPEVTYDNLRARLIAARNDAPLVKSAKQQAADYLRQKGVKLETSREAVENAFVLRDVFRYIQAEHSADAITMNKLLDAIMPNSEPPPADIESLNDEGALASANPTSRDPVRHSDERLSASPDFLNDRPIPTTRSSRWPIAPLPRNRTGKTPERSASRRISSPITVRRQGGMKIGQRVTNIFPTSMHGGGRASRARLAKKKTRYCELPITDRVASSAGREDGGGDARFPLDDGLRRVVANSATR